MVAILGCGWVGGALKDSLEQERIEVWCIPKERCEDDRKRICTCRVLVIAIPPRGAYLATVEEVLASLRADAQVILLSSISFCDGKPMVQAGERLVYGLREDAVVLRLGGLMGYDRIAGKYTAGKTLPHDSMSNYVHREDVVGVIAAVIMQEVRAEVLDVVAPVQHPKSQIFAANAEKFGFEQTAFDSLACRGKVISSRGLQERLGYRFLYPDVNDFWG